jgi:DNA-binding CsgD family transcriptional regulator
VNLKLRELRLVTSKLWGDAVRAEEEWAPDPPARTIRLIGRENELSVVETALDALAAGEGGVVVVAGAGRSGKTSIARYAAELAGARTESIEVVPVAPLATLIPAQANGEKSAVHPLLPPDELKARLTGVLPTDRLLVVIDDFHLADATTALSLQVSALSRTAPVLWLVTLTPGAASAAVAGAVDALVTAGAGRLALGPLGNEDVARLCRSVLGAPVSPELLRFAARAGGDPELCRELLLGLGDTGRTVVRDGVVHLVDGARRQPLPARCVDAVLRRLRGFSGAAMGLLEAGAVLGRPFTVHEAAGLTGHRVADLLTATAEATTAGILAETGGELEFCQPLVAGAVYLRLGEPARVALHREAAAVVWAERQWPMEVADHFVRSGGPGHVAPAVEVLSDAVRELASHAPGQAADLSLRLLNMLDSRHPLVGEMTADAVRLLSLSGRSQEARELCERGLHSGFDADVEAKLLVELSELTERLADTTMVTELTRRVLARHDLSDGRRAELLSMQAYGLVRVGEMAEAERLAVEAIDLARTSNRAEALVVGSLTHGLVLGFEGWFGQSLDHIRASVAMADGIGAKAQQRHPRLWLVPTLVALDRLDEAEATLEHLRQETEALGTGWPQPVWHYGLAGLLLARGELDAADAAAETGMALARDKSLTALLVHLLCLRAEIRIVRLELRDADRMLRDAKLAAERAGGEWQGRESVVWRRALWHEAGGKKVVRNRETAKLTYTLSVGAFLLPGCASTTPALVRLALRNGEKSHAARMAEDVRKLAAKNPGVASLAAASAQVDGLIADDPAQLTGAAELFRTGGRRLAQAAALLDAGISEAGRGELGRARELMAEATSIWSRCGAPGAAKRAEDRLARLEVPVAAATPAEGPSAALAARWASLTDTEVRVARLVAKGLTNKEVAAKLVLSPHTVGTHVRNSFTKLVVTNRVELALKVIACDQGASTSKD